MNARDKEGTQILAVSIDTHEDSRQLENQLAGASDFPLLEDRNHKVIDRYGLLNPDGSGWPHPATYVIDREGIVRWRFVEVDYTRRAGNEAILKALEVLP